jgi:hypothetical protein
VSLALALLLLVIYLLIYKVNPIANERLLCAAFAAYLGAFLVIAHIVSFRLWERHVVPVLPLFLLILVSGFDALWKKVRAKAQATDGENPHKGAVVGARGLQAVALAVVALLLLSSANLRYNPYYQQVDARGGLAYVRGLLSDASRGRVIFVRFGEHTHRYYGLSTNAFNSVDAFEKNKVYSIAVSSTDSGPDEQIMEIIGSKPPDTEYVFVFDTYFLSKNILTYFDEQGFAKNTDYHLVSIYTVD